MATALLLVFAGACEQPAPERSVPLQVATGPSGSVLALVPVYINDQGPYAFALDTGASQSVVDREIVERLNLPEAGPAGEVTGVSGTTEATQIRVEQWRVGDVALPATMIISLHMPEPDRRSGLQGLLGSDILSGFGAVTVDYEAETLILRSRR